uniref:Uncharacterized protein n=1 Tax=Anguilla anguilla TaxID=7936 RepID=A0A0E9SJX6_ANGAN
MDTSWDSSAIFHTLTVLSRPPRGNTALPAQAVQPCDHVLMAKQRLNIGVLIHVPDLDGAVM